MNTPILDQELGILIQDYYQILQSMMNWRKESGMVMISVIRVLMVMNYDFDLLKGTPKRRRRSSMKIA